MCQRHRQIPGVFKGGQTIGALDPDERKCRGILRDLLSFRRIGLAGAILRDRD